MALNTKGVANHLVTMLQGIAGVNLVQKGVPEKQDPRLAAYVTTGSQSLTRKTSATFDRWGRMLVTFSYLTKGAESDAEDALMDAVDAFIALVMADLTLDGLVLDTNLDLGMADTPEYSILAGREYREYPVVVMYKQQDTFNVNP